MTLYKKERALIIKLFYQNQSNASAALRSYRRMKNLRILPISVNVVKGMIRQFRETGSLDLTPRRGRCATEPAIVEKFVNATGEASARSSNATLTGLS